ncbi:MAG: hypothetical protein AB1768_21250, partial [Pseudomonadota bacterium]
MKIYGTIPVGEDLYTPEGRWRLRMSGEDAFRLQEIVESYLRREYRRLPDTHAAMEIHAEERKIYDAKSGRLLAESRTYSTNGGWISRNAGIELPLIVRPGCGVENPEDSQQTLLNRDVVITPPPPIVPGSTITISVGEINPAGAADFLHGGGGDDFLRGEVGADVL